MNNDEMINYIRHRMEQAEASVATFVANNAPDEILDVLARYNRLNQSRDPRRIMDGTLASYGLMRGILAHLEDGGWKQGE
jgi:hypothetical protein